MKDTMMVHIEHIGYVLDACIYMPSSPSRVLRIELPGPITKSLEMLCSHTNLSSRVVQRHGNVF